MIDVIFTGACIFTVLGFIFTPVTLGFGAIRTFKYLLPATTLVTIFTIVWALVFGDTCGN